MNARDIANITRFNEKLERAAKRRAAQFIKNAKGAALFVLNTNRTADDLPMLKRIEPLWWSIHGKGVTLPAAACPRCGGWTGSGGMSQHAKTKTPVLGRIGCICHK